MWMWNRWMGTYMTNKRAIGDWIGCLSLLGWPFIYNSKRLQLCTYLREWIFIYLFFPRGGCTYVCMCVCVYIYVWSKDSATRIQIFFLIIVHLCAWLHGIRSSARSCAQTLGKAKKLFPIYVVLLPRLGVVSIWSNCGRRPPERGVLSK